MRNICSDAPVCSSCYSPPLDRSFFGRRFKVHASYKLHFYGLFTFLILLSVPYATFAADAGSFLQAGDMALSRGQLSLALNEYSNFIKSDPKAALGYTKRASVYIQQKRYNNALNDLNDAIDVDSTYIQGYVQRGKLLKSICRYSSAIDDFNKILSLREKHKTAEKELQESIKAKESFERAKQFFESQKYDEAKTEIDNTVISISQECSEARLMKVQILMHKNDYGNAIVECGKILKFDENNLQILLMRGISYWKVGDQESSLKHFQKGLRLDPEHTELKKEYRKVKQVEKKINAGDEAFQKSKFRTAYEEYNAAVEMDPEFAQKNFKIQLGLCKAKVKLQKPKEASELCNAAYKLDENNPEIISLKAEAHLLAEEFEEAVKFYQKAREADPHSEEILLGLQKAEKGLKLSKRIDYYKVLGIEKNASPSEIKRAYKKLALVWHPDKNTDRAEEASKKFQEIAAAYEVLNDEEKRGKYDRGEDLEEIPQQGGHGFDPFGGGQQFTFQFEGGFPGGFGGGFPGGGFPGGFGGFG